MTETHTSSFDKKFNFLDKQNITASNLGTLNKELLKGNINPQSVPQLTNYINSCVAKLTPEQRNDPEFQSELVCIQNYTQMGTEKVLLKGSIASSAANDDFYKKVS
ncbi:hypothetical protein OAN96_00690 [Candidatus Gracilibacteria bacterium]|nr:hypothetical protein [Candidatus Gracilibacteria bacterium]